MDLTPGSYITDDTQLLYVVRALRNELLLEDCADPELPLVSMTVRELAGFRNVRPLRRAA